MTRRLAGFGLKKSHEYDSSEIHQQYVIQCRHSDCQEWVVESLGEIFLQGSPEAEEAEKKAHKSLDRCYGGPMITRLILVTRSVSVSHEEIPALWEKQ